MRVAVNATARSKLHKLAQNRPRSCHVSGDPQVISVLLSDISAHGCRWCFPIKPK